ncbi:MAG: transglutaminase-like cysteine peptidase [Magnetococcus sp. YQC-9]
MERRSIGLFGCVFVLTTAWSLAVHGDANSQLVRFFRESSSRSDDSGRSEKLARALERHAQVQPDGWRSDLAEMSAIPLPARLQAVQERVNRRIAYRDDPENIFLAPVDAYRDGGDCEDFAIAKMLLLMESGVPEKYLRLITLAPTTTNGIYHVILVAWLQEKMYVLDSPKRIPEDRVVDWERYRDADRPVVWAGWSGGGASFGGADSGAIWERRGMWAGVPVGGKRIVSYRQFPEREKLLRIAADWLVIHPWEPPLTAAEVERLRLLRVYYHQPTPENARLLSAFEVKKLEELRRIRQAL